MNPAWEAQMVDAGFVPVVIEGRTQYVRRSAPR